MWSAFWKSVSALCSEGPYDSSIMEVSIERFEVRCALHHESYKWWANFIYSPKLLAPLNTHHTITMLFASLVLLTLLPAVFGQSWQQYLNGLVQALNAGGYTTLASATAALNITSDGQRLVQSLSTGNWTLFVPNNQACKHSNLVTEG